jgi:hypothetical protein
MKMMMAVVTLLNLSAAEARAEQPLPPYDAPLRILWEVEPVEQYMPVIDWLAARGWCWGIEARAFTRTEALEMLRARGFYGVMHLHAHTETWDEDWAYKKRFEDREVPDRRKAIERLRAVYGDDATANVLIEDDSSGVGFSGEYLRDPPADHAEALAMFEEYLEEAMGTLKEWPAVHAWGMNGYATSAHAYARHGVECIICERTNDDVDDLQTAIAFCRGAARQYGCNWGIDLSLWWGVFSGCVHELPASLYKRHLYISYFSGSRTFRIEGGGFILGDPDNPLPIAAEIDAFAKKVRNIDPGTPDVPAAVMLAKDHGWMTPPYWRVAREAWNYARLPYRQGQRGIDGFFGAAFPGSIYAMDPFPFGAYEKDDPPGSPYAVSCVTPDFAPSPEKVYYAEPPIPFGRFDDRREALRAISGQKLDPSPYRAMGDSRWGDIFDVLTEEASLEALERYEVLVLLGQIQLTDKLRARLLEWVRAGGTLLIAAGVVTPEDAALCGFSIEPELRVGRAWQWRQEASVHEAFRYVPANLPSDGSVQALASTPSGKPLITEYHAGKGRVITSLIPWFEGGHRDLAGPAARLFDLVFEEVQPVRVDGLPVEWVSAKGDAHRTLTIANHDGAPWQGKVYIRHVNAAFGNCVDLVTGETLAFERAGDGAVLEITIPPYDVRVIRFS